MATEDCLREEFWHDFNHLARETIAQEMFQLGQSLQSNLIQELHVFFDAYQSSALSGATANSIACRGEAGSAFQMHHTTETRKVDCELLPVMRPRLVYDRQHGMMAPKRPEAPAFPPEDMTVLNECIDMVPATIPGQTDASIVWKSQPGETEKPPVLRAAGKADPLPMHVSDGVVAQPIAPAWNLKGHSAPSMPGQVEDEQTRPPSVHGNRFTQFSMYGGEVGQHAASEKQPDSVQVDNRWDFRRTRMTRPSACTTDRRVSEATGFWSSYSSGRMTAREAFVGWCKSEKFDYWMGAALLANAVSIGVQVDVMSGLDTDTLPWHLRVIDGIFCVIFVLELSVRIFIWRRDFFCGRGYQWNYFDLVVVGFQVIDEFFRLFLTGSEVQKTVDSMGVVRMLRLARIARLVRMVRLVPELKSMVYLISASMHAFLWTVALLLILIYCVAVYFTELASDSKGKVSDDASANLVKNFGSLLTSILSLFQAISGGDDWRNFMDDFHSLSAVSRFTNVLVFCLYICFATLVMLNLVTGVFVEGAQRLIQEEQDGELVRHVRQLFNVTDADLSGEICFDEFSRQLNTEKFKDFLHNIDLQNLEATSLFNLLDADKSGTIDMEEFIQGCMHLRGHARSVDLSALKHDFDEMSETWSHNMQHIDHNIKDVVTLLRKDMQSSECASEMVQTMNANVTLILQYIQQMQDTMSRACMAMPEMLGDSLIV